MKTFGRLSVTRIRGQRPQLIYMAQPILATGYDIQLVKAIIPVEKVVCQVTADTVVIRRSTQAEAIIEVL